MVHPTPREPVVVEPVVNREKLLELLALEVEYSTLDFKSRLDLGDKRDVVELAKDIGAMSMRGGYLVIGVDGHGKPTGELTAEQAARFDEAQLRPKLLRWLPDELKIASQVHELDGGQVVLLQVSPHPAGCAFFRADGQYDGGGKTSKVVFREGEVFFRDGTQSVRLDQRGLEQVIRQRVERERGEWENQHAQSYRRLADELRTGAAGQRVARGPAVEFNLALEPEVLIEAAIELLRADDDIPLRRLLGRAVPESRTRFTAEDQEGLSGILNRLAGLAVTFLELDRSEWAARVVDTLVSIYELGFENVPPIYNDPPPRSAALWLAIVERVVALGAFAVRSENWEAVRYIASRRPEGMDKVYKTWLRHASTMAARAELYPPREVDAVGILLSLAREVVRQVAPLRPDAGPDDDKILTSLARFDFLAALVSLADSGNGLYPHFARFDGARVEPVVQRLLQDSGMRTTIYPGDDRQLAAALREINSSAQQVAFLHGGWDGYPAEVNAFIARHGDDER